jgi:epoxide hydrolase
LSRRTLLGGLAAAAAAATGLARAGRVFASAGPTITPFRYRAPASALDDLKRRLAQTRWPDPETVADWSQGVPITK